LSTFSFGQESFERFKKSETIFILSDIYDTATYESILKDSWTITPYKVIKKAAFNPEEYISDKYSFVVVENHIVMNKFEDQYTNTIPGIYLFMFKMEDKQKELAKFIKMSEEKKDGYDLMLRNRINMRSIVLQPNEALIKLMLVDERLRTERYILRDIEKQIDKSESFHSYKPGFLKNYFQFINTMFLAGKIKSKFTDDVALPALKELKKQILYIPNYATLHYDPLSGKEKAVEKSVVDELFKDYKYKYEILTADQISDKIMAGEDFYYLRYTRSTMEKFIQIVNSKSGEIVYSRKYTGLTNYQIESSYFKDLKKAVDTGKM
jgi:hypothetical protein